MTLCESGWTGDRCQLPLDHEGPHDNEVRPMDRHADDGTCHEECWRRAVAEHEADR